MVDEGTGPRYVYVLCTYFPPVGCVFQARLDYLVVVVVVVVFW